MDPFNLDSHLGVMKTCQASWQGRELPMATPPGTRYPYVYPRDLAAIARALYRIPHERHDGGPTLRSAAEFLLEAQGPDHLWGQRYDLDGTDRSIYMQEDNTAHAVATLARHLRHERRQGGPSSIEKRCLESMERGLSAALSRVYRKGINLFFSTTSVHESAMEKGYTLWTNGSYRDAMRLTAEAAELAGEEEMAARWTRRLLRHEENMSRHFIQDGQWIRRVSPEGRFDRRPDVTLLSPYYFGFEHLDPEAADVSARRVEEDLWDPDLGLLQRYLPFREDRAVHLHAGNGPWLAYSAWLAQRHAEKGDPRRAKELLTLIHRFASPEGWLPEHVSTSERYHDFMTHEWETGLDFRKEFDGDILLPKVGFSEILDEAVLMRRAYTAAGQEAERSGDGIIRFATPLAWCHAEFAVALALLDKRAEREKEEAKAAGA